MCEKTSARLKTLKKPEKKAIATTAKNLPVTISVERIGAVSSVCSVPRSFSPAVRSIAGWKAPRITVSMISIGRNCASR